MIGAALLGALVGHGTGLIPGLRLALVNAAVSFWTGVALALVTVHGPAGVRR
ncbi:hypothetical protein ABT297_27450 [Dactylosporangium sp. NPDC000555]|uniref:hypothetical protein n=1 Tax=Dactylosporangium sp. NPDC000555 TaxID=3154260 RepID=UPI00331E7066